MKLMVTVKCSNCGGEQVEELTRVDDVDFAAIPHVAKALNLKPIDLLSQALVELRFASCCGYHTCDDTHVAPLFIKHIELVGD